MSHLADDLRQQASRTLDELRTLRDEIRVRLHLAGMEARTRWSEDLEPRLFQLEQQLKGAGEQAEEAAKTALHELTEAVRRFRANLGGDRQQDEG